MAAAPVPLSAVGLQRRRVGRLAMRLFLLSLGMLFAASLVGHLAVRVRAQQWPPEGAGLPSGLWLSTAAIVLASGALQGALAAVRAGHQRRLRRGLVLGLMLGLVFVGLQVHNWWVMVDRGLVPQSSLFAWTFFMLTWLHAAHLVGGLAALAVVVRRARRGAYAPHRPDGVEYVTTYWHFLGGVWLVMVVILHL